MKKSLIALSIAALALTVTTPVFAKDGNKNDGKGLGGFFGGIIKHFEHKFPATSFVISGTVVSTTANSVVVNVQTSANIQTLSGGQATIATDSNTKVTGQKNTTITLADVKAGDRVQVSGSVSGTTLTAANIRDSGPAPATPATISGKVTAVSSTSITLVNGLANTTQIFTIDSNTKVAIDGQSKTVADILVGDAGSIRSKTASGVFSAQMINLFR